jgi:hypothetical protein
MSQKKHYNTFSTHTSFYNETPKSNSFRNTSLITPLYKSNNGLDSNKIRNKLFNLNKTLQTKNYSENDYVNRPTITFKPKMPLYNFEKSELINPSKMNYVVSINPPPCHRNKKGFASLNKNFNNNNNKKNNLTFTFMKPELKKEISDFENGLISSFRKISLKKKENLY